MSRAFVTCLVLLGALVAVVFSAGAVAASEDGEASSSAVVVKVAVPGAPAQTSSWLVGPPATSGGGSFAFPADGSLVSVGATSASVAAQPGTSSSADAAAEALAVSLFAGEITAETVSARITAAAGGTRALAQIDRNAVTGLVVLGQPVAVEGPLQMPLADWGTLEALIDATTVSDDPPHSASATAIALRVSLTADHGGYPAGTTIDIASLDVATAAADAPAPVDTVPSSTPAAPGAVAREPKGDGFRDPPKRPAGVKFEAGSSIEATPAEIVQPAPEVIVQLSNGGYVFPVFGPASFGDSFGAYRSDVPGNWHHGEDIVAPNGTPLLAVADGTVFSVGWNDIGGWRLWLRDARGNEFYYAHLSAYSPLAVDGSRVKAGDVLGFVGSTGDAEGGVPHLHFEIHPAELLSLGYDGVVAPYTFLIAWRRAEDVSFDAGRRYLPTDVPGGAPALGAYLLEIRDVAATSGLVPGSIERAVSARRK